MGHGIGRITKGIAQNQLQKKTIDFVYDNLPGWRNDPKRPVADSENDLNASLCKYLQVCASNSFSMVHFFHQERQGVRHSADLSASPTSELQLGGRLFDIYTPFLVLEGKRLPAPTTNRKKEYVTGGVDKAGKPLLTGGIQRFKLGLHGADHAVAVMLGYIQENSTGEWHSTVNDWIAELAGEKSPDGCRWATTDKLGKQKVDSMKRVARSESVHKRNVTHAGVTIRLYHLWVRL